MGMLVAVAGIFAGLLLAAPAVHATTAPPPASESPAPESSTEATPQESGNSEGDEETDGAEYQDRISGVLRNAGAPVAGVTIKASGNGYEAETQTAENGSWSIGVPEQGAFEVELDESTLPEGTALAEGQQNPRTVTFAGTSNITTLFLLGEGIVLQGDTFGTKLIERAVAGLSFGLLLALSAVGLSLIFGTTGLTNFAHGEMVTLGAVLALIAMAPTGTTVERAGLRSVISGLRYLGGHPVLLVAMLLDLLAMGFGMPRALYPEMAEVDFGGSPMMLSALYSSLAVGAVLGGLFSGWITREVRQGKAVTICIVVWGLAVTIAGIAVMASPGAVTAWAVLVIVMLIVGGAADMFSASLRTILSHRAWASSPSLRQ